MKKRYLFIALIGLFVLGACGKKMSESDYVAMWEESSNDYADFLLESTTQSDKTNDDYLKISSSLQDKLKEDIKILKNVKHKEQINKDLQSLDEKMILSIDYYTKLTNGEETSTEEAEASYQTGNKVVSFASKYNDGKLPDSFVSLMNKFNNENTSDSSESFSESSQSSENSTESSSFDSNTDFKFSIDKIAFDNFNIEPFNANIKKVDSDYVLFLEFDWYNQSFSKETSFLTASSIDAYQGDTLLKQITPTEGNMNQEVKIGSAITVQAKFQLISTETPIKVNFINNQSQGQEIKSMMITSD